MVKLKLGADEYPLSLTVRALDVLAQKGVTIENLSQYFAFEKQTLSDAVDHGLEVLDILIAGGSAQHKFYTGVGVPTAPDMQLLRDVLTPGQVWGLCEAAIIDSLKRTVEADTSKNAGSAV